MSSDTLTDVINRYRQARERRSSWEAHWQECYDYALPQRGGMATNERSGKKKTDKLFDGTAPDGVDQLAASLLSQLTPPWAQWFGLAAGTDVPVDRHADFTAELERSVSILQSHFDRSNFAVEMHQCYLDLVTAGTASLLFEEAAPGEPSAFRFTAVPLSQVVLEEGPDGRLDTTFRQSGMTGSQISSRFPDAELPQEIISRTEKNPEARIPVIEAVFRKGAGYSYMAVLEPGAGQPGEAARLAQGEFEMSPFINFRWLKAPGESYGRSPVMKVLPDIKTANKVVELILKNASIAVTGIWQADDDGVLNPATIKLVPGTIIPKAVGSAGLTPLEAPGRFDISESVLQNLRSGIRRGLMVDHLGQINSPKMTATEILERSAEMTRVLGATYGRLQSELLNPLVSRAIAILERRGEIPNTRIDGRMVDLQYKSPLARYQARQDAQSTLLWLDAIRGLGPQALETVDQAATARWLGKAFGVPGNLIHEAGATANLGELSKIIGETLGQTTSVTGNG